jgi:ankyrin repeat protein
MTLFEAAKAGKLATLRRLIEAGADVNAQARGRDTILGYAENSGTPLMAAAERGHAEPCRALLDAGAKVNVRNANGSTALMHAAAPGHREVVRLLLDAGAAVDTADKQGRNALQVAAWAGHADVVQALLDAGASPNHKDGGNRTPVLMWAAWQRHHDVVRRLIKAGADLEATDKFGNTSLITAVEYADLAMVQLLLKAGANVQGRNEAGYTALMSAADAERAAKARLLLRYGADVNIGTANFDETPLMSAASEGCVPLVRLFLKAGADINHKDRDGETALFQAVQQGHLAVIRVLLEAGANVNIKDRQGQTPLAVAAEKGDAKLFGLLQRGGARDRKDSQAKGLDEESLRQAAVQGNLRRARELLRAGVDVNARKQYGSPPLWHAADNGHLEVVRGLLRAGAKADRKGEYDSTPLIKAAEGGHTEVVRALIAAGANVNATYDRCMRDVYTGWTALMAAAEGGHADMVRDLLAAGASPNARTVLSFTPLLLAVLGRHRDVANALLAAGAEVDDCAAHFLKVLDFAAAVRQPAFRNAAEGLGKAVGVKPQWSRNFPDAALYNLARSQRATRLKPQMINELTAEILDEGNVEDEAEARKAAEDVVKYHLADRVAAVVVEESQDKFLRQGHYVVEAKLNLGCEYLALLPTTDRYAALACLGPNTGGGIPYHIGWLKELAQEQPFELAGCGYDTLKVRFIGRVRDRDRDRLARRIFKLGTDSDWRPDEIGVMAEGSIRQTGSVKDLADALRQDNVTLRLWWD